MVHLQSRQEHNAYKRAFSLEKEAPVHENDNSAQGVAPTGSIYKMNAFRMAEMGYHPLPVGSGTKYPCIGKWQRYCRASPSIGDIEQYSRIPDAGVSLATGSPIGTHIMIAIDVDVEDGRLDLIADSLPYSPMEKIGRKGFTRFYRADPSVVTNRYDDEAGTRLIDLLSRSVNSDGKSSGSQTVIPPSVHPETGLAYRWIKGPVPAADLPIFDTDAMARLEDTLAHCGWISGHVPREVEDAPQHPSVSSREDGSFGRELNDLAMANFEAWVPNLGLYGARSKSGGFEAVPSFRPSGSSRALEQRGRKLSFVASGIRDFGTGVGYTPIDLTSAALGLSGVEAIQWLKVRLVPRVDTSDLDGLDVLYYEKQSREAEATAALSPTPAVSPLSGKLSEAKDGTLADAATGEIIPPRASLNGLAAVWDDREANAALGFEWLIKGMFPRRGVSLLWGQSGSGKSFVSLELAACIATGKPFFGNRTKATGGVLFALGEGTGSMPIRLNALRKEGFPRPAPLNPATGQLLDLDHLPFVWVSVDNLSKPGPFAIFANAVRREAGEMASRHGCALRLIIVDTVVAAFGFEDDPDATKVTTAMRALDGLAQELGLLIVAVHHAGKSKAAGEHGSYAWRGSAETSIEVDADRDSVGVVKERRVWVRKNRHGAEGFNRPFELRSVYLGNDEDGDEISSAIVVPFEPEVEVTLTCGGTPAVGAGRVLDAFASAFGQAEMITTEDGRQVEAIRRVVVRAMYAPNDPGKVDSVNKRFSRDLDHAIDLGLVEKGTARNAVWLWLLASNDNDIILSHASDA